MSTQPILLNTRAGQTLLALYENGPMSARGLLEIMEPRPNIRRVQEALRRLRKYGLVVPRFESIPANAGNYYQLTYRKEWLPIISQILGVDVKSVNTPGISSSELIHSQECALWAHRFKQYSPEATILRDHLFAHNEEAKNVLLMSNECFEIKPDLLLLYPKSTNQHHVRIAVEIERTPKTKARIQQKLKRYAMGTRLDGVIYICSTDSIVEAVRSVYKDRVIEKSPRINRYGSRFVMFAMPSFCRAHENLMLLDAELRATTFEKWKSFLIQAPPDYSRREETWAAADVREANQHS